MSKASESLNLSVSALSRRVQKLEQHIGRKLFTRAGNEFRLNDEGHRLLGAIEEPFDRLADAFAERGPDRPTQLTVGVPTSFATAWLIPRLAQFREDHPEIELRIDTSGSPIEKLGRSLDVIIFFARDGAETIEIAPLRRQGAFGIARKGVVDPLRGLRSTLRETTLLAHRHLPEILDRWLHEMGLPADFPLRVDYYDDGPLLIAAAQNGLGLALVLEDMVNFYGEAPGLIRPFGEYVRTPFSYALASGNGISPGGQSARAIKRFSEWIARQTELDGSLNLAESAKRAAA